MRFNILAFLLLLLLLAVPAFAEVVTVDWTNPTTNIDGSALAATSITKTRIEYGTCLNSFGQAFTGSIGTSFNGQFGTKIGEFSVNGQATTANSPNLSPGNYCFRAYTTAGGVESGPSGVAAKTVAPPTPNPPSSLRVTALTAYSVVKQKDRFILLAVGTVPAGTSCVPEQSVNGFNVVPRAAVTWTGTSRPDVVVAKCS